MTLGEGCLIANNGSWLPPMLQWQWVEVVIIITVSTNITIIVEPYNGIEKTTTETAENMNWKVKVQSTVGGIMLIIWNFTSFPQKFLSLFVKISFITNPRTPTTNSRQNSCWFWPPAQLRSQQHSNNYVGPRFERRACNRNYRIGNISLCIRLDSSLRDLSK